MRNGLLRHQRWPGWLSCLVFTSCAVVTMKPPARGTQPKPLLVSGYQPTPYGRDSALRIGDATVDEVKGTPVLPPGLSAYGRTGDYDRWEYSFRLRRGPSELRAACVERVESNPYLGFAAAPLDLHCTCTQGDTVHAQLALKSKGGEARLADGSRYQVWATRAGQNGRARAILGYVFRNGAHDGGIDVTRRGARGYLPQALSPELEPGLRCLYAALLLHRPTK